MTAAFWAHVGWILYGEANHNNTKLMSKYAPDLAKHRFYRLAEQLSLDSDGGAGTVAAGHRRPADDAVGHRLRVVVGLHATWLVNSATHMWGSRRFNTRDDSRNNWWVALITFGEGWHNNHHAHPTSARHGLTWYEFDWSWQQIRLLKRLGIAKKIHVATVTSVSAEREAA